MARIQSDTDSSGAPDTVTAVAGTAIGSATKSGMCHSTSMTSIMSDETTDSHSHSEVVGPSESTSASMGSPKLGSPISGERIPVDTVVVVNGCIAPAEGSLRLSKKRSIDRSCVKEPFPLGPVLPLASLSLRMAEPPAPPLLALGHGNSSSHLSLVSLDPHRSIIRREALMKLKQDYIVYGSGRPSLKQTEREKERERKRSARDRADEEEQKRLMKKRKEKMLPIVTKDSLFALERQLCSRQESSPDDEGDESKMKKPLSPLASRATTELAALALARHLVDWTESLGVDIVSDSEDEEEEDAEETEMQEDVEHIDGDVDAHESGTSPMLLASPSPPVLPSSDDSLPSAQPCFLQRQASSSCLVPLVYSPTTSMSTASSLSSSTSMECPLTSTTMTPSTSVWTPELHHQSSTGTMDSFESLEDEHDHLQEYHDHGDYSSCQQSVEYTTLNQLLDQPPTTDYPSMVEFEMPPIMADTYLTSSSLLSLSPLPSPKLSPLSSSSLLPAFPFHSFNSPQHPPQHPPQHWAFSLDSVTLAGMTPMSQKMDFEGIESALSVPLATTTTSTSTISLIQRKTIPLKT